MEFRELSDEEWELIKPLLPPKAKTGRPRADDRRVLNGILYVLTTGCRWMDMPPNTDTTPQHSEDSNTGKHKAYGHTYSKP